MRWWPLLVVSLPVLSPEPAFLSQEGVPQAATARGFDLQPADPNPFEEGTRIPFVLGAGAFRDDGRATVSMRVYNLLHQVVGIPTVRGEEGSRSRLDGREYTEPGRYVARWDGRDVEGRPVSSGPYFVQLTVDGQTQVRKVLLVR